MVQQQKLILIDGHSLAFRAFYALSNADLRTTDGEPTYAVYGFANILLNIIQEHTPDYVALSFDIGRTFRHDAYPEYKAGRAKTPEEFHPQLERIKQLVAMLNIPIYTYEGYEADDVIGTLSRQATEHHVHTLILSGDSDVLQLVDDHVSVLLAQPYSRKIESILYDKHKVRTRYKGLQPNQLTDLRGLKGDASDNIPGVKGIGESSAITLLNQYSTIENLYDNLHDVHKRYRKHLEGQKEQAIFSKYLATIVCDIPLVLSLQDARLGGYEQTDVIALFHELEFASLIQKLPQTHHDERVLRGIQVEEVPWIAGETPNPPPCTGELGEDGTGLPHAEEVQKNVPSRIYVDPDFATQLSMFAPSAPPHTSALSGAVADMPYHAIVNDEALQEMLTILDAAPSFAFDLESTGLKPMHSDIVGIALAVEPGKAWYIPVAHRQGQQLPRQQVLDALHPFFTDPHKPKYAHNAKFDMELLRRAGVAVEGLAFDTMIAAGLLGKKMKLKELAFNEFKLTEPLAGIEDLIGRGARQMTFDRVYIEHATPYAAADADMTLRLVEILRPQIAARPHIEHIFTRIEMPLISVLVDMEYTGIALDVDYMRDLSKRITTLIDTLQQQIYSMAGGSFNINSSIQLNEVLFERLKLAPIGLNKTTSGRYSLRADALEKLSDSHEIVGLILEYRHLAKLKSTYADALPTMVHPETKRIHTSFNQMGTATGRLASSSPNLQNIPIRTDIGSEIRQGFVAAPGCAFIGADYSQVELRVLAHITQDQNLVQAFMHGQDIHAAMAAHLFHVPVEAVEKNQRRMAKMTVFGIIYGISSFGLAKRTDLPRQHAQALIDAFFERFPGVRRYIDTTLEHGRRNGYVESLFGRRRAMPDLLSKGSRRQAAEREAINTPIQGTAADIMKLAMINVAHTLKHHHYRTQIVLQVHDELILESPLDEVDEVQQIVREAMEGAYTLCVPLTVDVEVGSNWEHMEKIQQS